MTCWHFQPTNRLLRCLHQHGHAAIRRRAAGRSVFFTEETDAVRAAGIAPGSQLAELNVGLKEQELTATLAALFDF
jgi:hypothetical protein